MSIPRFDKPVVELVKKYQLTMAELTTILRAVDYTTYKGVNAGIKAAKVVLGELDLYADNWVESNFKKNLKDIVTKTLQSIKESDLLGEEVDVSKNVLPLYNGYVDDTKNDLKTVIQNLNRKITSSIRLSQLKHQQGFRDADIRRAMLEAVNYGLIDNAGRKWKPFTYAQVVAETKTYNFYRDVVLVVSLAMGIDYAVISSHGATDSCANFEGKVIKLRNDAPGDFETYVNLTSDGRIFHVHCKHIIIPIKQPYDLPDDISTIGNSPSFESKVMGLPKDF